MRVLYIVNVPSPYMVNYFNELGKYCDLTVIFEKNTSTERDKSWKNYKFLNFKGIILKGINTDVDAALCPQIIKYLRKGIYDFIFISNMATPTGIIAIEYLKWRKIDYFLESEGGFAKSGKGLKEMVKKRIMSNAKCYFSTTPIGDDYFITYGADKKRIVKYPFTSLYQKDIVSDVLSCLEKRKLKAGLGINEKTMIISVGQFIPRKGFDVLLKACSLFRTSDIGIYIIGGKEPTQEYKLLIKSFNLNNVHFVPFKRKEELDDYYKAADIFVLPTREDVWGLVINEAMAKGLPVITTQKCIAGTELIENGENGYIVPVDDSEELAKKMNILVEDKALRIAMGKKSIKKIKWYTFENMAKVHIDFLYKYKKIQAKPTYNS